MQLDTTDVKKYVAYYRVSTKMQQDLVETPLNNKKLTDFDKGKYEQRGLGLQSQRQQVLKYVDVNKGHIISEYTEIETGTSKRKRVEIYKAIDEARESDATLIVAKLDRLARDVEFTSVMYRSGVDFICCDNPNANRLTIQILAIVAENEASAISSRVKGALAIKKENIKKGIYLNKNGELMKPIETVKIVDGKEVIISEYRLGGPKNFTDEMRQKARDTIKRNALENTANVQALEAIITYKKLGLSFQDITDKLNKLKYKTRNGCDYKLSTVHKLYNRYKSTISNDCFFVYKESTVKKIILDSRQNGLTYQKITDYLNELGLKNKRGKEFKLCTVRNYHNSYTF